MNSYDFARYFPRESFNDRAHIHDYTSNLTPKQIKQVLIDAKNVFKFCLPQFMTAKDYYDGLLPSSKWFERNNQHILYQTKSLRFAIKHPKYHYNSILVTSHQYLQTTTLESLIDLKCNELHVLYYQYDPIDFTNLPENIKVLKIDSIIVNEPVLRNTLPKSLDSLHFLQEQPRQLYFDNAIELVFHTAPIYTISNLNCPNIKRIIFKRQIAWDQLYLIKDFILHVESVGPNHSERIFEQKRLYTMAYLKLKLQLKELHVKQWDQNWLPRQLVTNGIPFYVDGKKIPEIVSKVNRSRKRKCQVNE